MHKERSIDIFNQKNVRRYWDAEKELWYFSVIDVIEILTDSTHPYRYWSNLKIKLKSESSEVYEKIVHLKLLAPEGNDGRHRFRNRAAARGLFPHPLRQQDGDNMSPAEQSKETANLHPTTRIFSTLPPYFVSSAPVPKTSLPSLGRALGSTLAYVSHSIDCLTEWSFQKMKQAGDAKKTTKIEPKNKYARGAVKAGQTILGALGHAGDAYYQTYGELKKRHAD